ncbi:MAG: putative ABC exporter domain-containing protein [Clostridia bacterium]|nr:putative ABC exporter domain-containing protein [Clostridia bacterium]
MRLFAYYAFHAFVNQLKKLFRTWVMIFILVCVAFGVVIGLIAAFIDEKVSEGGPEDDPSSVVVPDDDLPEEPGDGSDDAFIFTDSQGNVEFVLDAGAILDLVVTAVIVFIFVFMVMMMDKGSFFLPADTVLLFTSPMTPQGVVFFRLSCTMGSMLFAGIYILFQIPNLVYNAGLDVAAVAAVGVGYVLTLTVSVILKVAAYVYSAADRKKADTVKYAGIGLLLAMFAGGFVYKNIIGMTSLPGALFRFFSLKETRFFPFVGWIKGFIMYTAEKNYIAAALCLAATVGGAALLIFAVSKMKADFYEEAMAKSEEVAAALQAQKEKGSLFSSGQRKKDRADRLKRDGLKHGRGANIFFFKEMYNRFRFAALGIFTKTSVTYLIIGLGITAVLRFFTDVRSVLPAALAVAAFAFYRTLGNPLEKDISLPYFPMIPASAGAKLFWSVLAGVTNTALDVIVPVVVSGIVMGESPLTVVICILLILSIDFYSTVVGTFIGVSLPQNAGTMLKQVIQIMFLYFGLIPDIAAIGIAAALGNIAVGLGIAFIVNLGIGALFFAFLPVFF